MKKITKKEIREVLRDAREEHPFGWRLASVTGYIYNGEVGIFTHYHGQGIYEFLMDTEKYLVSTCDLTDLCCKYEYTLKDATDAGYEIMQDMIKEHWGIEK